MKLKIHLCCFSAELILLWKPFYPQSSGHFQSSADVTLLLNTSLLFVWSIAVKTVRCRCERSLTVSHLLLFVIFNLKKKKKSMSSIDTSLIFDTREFNVRHLYTGSSPAKQSSYFNHSEREREWQREASYSHKSFLMRSIITCRDDRGRHYPKCNQRLELLESLQVPYLNCL